MKIIDKLIILSLCVILGSFLDWNTATPVVVLLPMFYSLAYLVIRGIEDNE